MENTGSSLKAEELWEHMKRVRMQKKGYGKLNISNK